MLAGGEVYINPGPLTRGGGGVGVGWGSCKCMPAIGGAEPS